MDYLDWPTENPIEKKQTKIHGWLGHGNKQELERVIAEPGIYTVCELGSWYGKSADYIMKNACNLSLICVDLWSNEDIEAGNQVIKTNTQKNYGALLKKYELYETFLANVWEYRDRLIPLKMDTLAGLRKMKELEITPDAIYIDANHTYEDVKAEIKLSLELFPNVILLGDDINWSGVKKAVVEMGLKYDYKLIKNRNCWRYFKTIPKECLDDPNIKVLL